MSNAPLSRFCVLVPVKPTALAKSRLAYPLCAPCRGNRPGYSLGISPAARMAIYERDARTCGICCEPVDSTVPANSRWGATLDHIVPRSSGGSDDPANLRLAHRHCNSKRGAPELRPRRTA